MENIGKSSLVTSSSSANKVNKIKLKIDSMDINSVEGLVAECSNLNPREKSMVIKHLEQGITQSDLSGDGNAKVKLLDRIKPNIFFSPGAINLNQHPDPLNDGVNNNPSKKHTPAELTKASKTITRGFRSGIANRAFLHMTGNQTESNKGGEIWATKTPMYQQQNPTQKHSGKALIQAYSKKNIADLKRVLSNPPLTKDEKEFIQAFKDTPLYLTHFTNDRLGLTRNVQSLHSRKKLIDDEVIPFDTSHTNLLDIQQLKNDDFVFYSIETGATPAKTSSRFGDNLIRKELQGSDIVNAWVTVVDQLPEKIGKSPTQLDNDIVKLDLRDDKDKEYLDRRLNNKGIDHELDDHKGIFYGSDIKEGLALSLVKTLRGFTPETRDRLLKEPEPEKINMLLNTLYRPEAKIPRMHFIKNANVYLKSADTLTKPIAKNDENKIATRLMDIYKQDSGGVKAARILARLSTTKFQQLNHDNNYLDSPKNPVQRALGDVANDEYADVRSTLLIKSEPALTLFRLIGRMDVNQNELKNEILTQLNQLSCSDQLHILKQTLMSIANPTEQSNPELVTPQNIVENMIMLIFTNTPLLLDKLNETCNIAELMELKQACMKAPYLPVANQIVNKVEELITKNELPAEFTDATYNHLIDNFNTIGLTQSQDFIQRITLAGHNTLNQFISYYDSQTLTAAARSILNELKLHNKTASSISQMERQDSDQSVDGQANNLGTELEHLGFDFNVSDVDLNNIQPSDYEQPSGYDS